MLWNLETDNRFNTYRGNSKLVMLLKYILVCGSQQVYNISALTVCSKFCSLVFQMFPFFP